MQPSVRAHNLEGFLLGTVPSPLQFIDIPDPNGSQTVIQTLNLEFVIWNRQDQYVVSWLLSFMSEPMLGHVTMCVRAAEIWYTLERLNLTQSRARVLQLRATLQTLKKGDMSIEEYFVKMKNVADLRNVSTTQTITDDELLLYILGGLGTEYESVIIHLTSRQGAVSLEEAQFMLQTQEMRIEHQINQATSELHGTPSANYANFRRGQAGVGSGGRGQSYNGRGGHGFRGRGGRGRGTSKPTCQICGRTGHAVNRCYHRFDITFQGNQQSGGQQSRDYNAGLSGGQHGNHHAYLHQAEVDVATSSGGLDGDSNQNWYVDSGATNHVTAKLQNLNIHQDYKGKGKLSVSNGSQLKISHIGDIYLHSYHSKKPLVLHYTLHVPDITKNLISISQFTKDNDVVIEFFFLIVVL